MARRNIRASQHIRNRTRYESPLPGKRSASLLVEPLEDRSMLSTYAPGELLIQYDSTVDVSARSEVRRIVAGRLIEQIQTNAMKVAGQGILERVSLGGAVSVESAIERIQSLPGVRFAEPNWVYTPTDVSNDTYYLNGSLWGMYSDDSPSAIGPAGTSNSFGSQSEDAWNNGFVGSNSVYVGVIDEGIQYTHPDLAANVWTNPFDPIDGIDNDGNGRIDDSQGWDFYSDDRTVYDGTGDDHGTHVAGTIGARGGNGTGVAGVNWNVTLISTKFLGPLGGYTSGAVQALDYLTDLKIRHGLNIVATNNSWGGGGFSQSLLDAITRAANQGILFVAAAGNASSNNDAVASYPSNYDTTAGAGYDSVIGVASITSTGGLSSFSSYGSMTVDLGAPGTNITSTLPTNTYGAYSGTSMATPHVTGAVALYASANPGATAAQIRSALLSSTSATTSLAGKTVTGGRLNVGALLGASIALPSLSISDVSVTEGNSGTTSANFTVTLSSASGNAVSVNFATANGSALSGSDFNSSSGVLNFAAGETSKTIAIQVVGDLNVEANETFAVNLSGATNATIGDSSGTGTILNDDVSSGVSLSISDVTAYENQGPFVFNVTLSAPSASTVNVNYATVSGSARGGGGKNADFTNKSGTLTFSPGQTLKTISISIKNDANFEQTESFYVDLSAPFGAAISDNRGTGTILNDDSGVFSTVAPTLGTQNSIIATASQPQALADAQIPSEAQGPVKARDVLAELVLRVNAAASQGLERAQAQVAGNGPKASEGDLWQLRVEP